MPEERSIVNAITSSIGWIWSHCPESSTLKLGALKATIGAAALKGLYNAYCTKNFYKGNFHYAYSVVLYSVSSEVEKGLTSDLMGRATQQVLDATENLTATQNALNKTRDNLTATKNILKDTKDTLDGLGDEFRKEREQEITLLKAQESSLKMHIERQEAILERMEEDSAKARVDSEKARVDSEKARVDLENARMEQAKAQEIYNMVHATLSPKKNNDGTTSLTTPLDKV